MLCSAFMSFSGVTFPVSSHPSPTPLSPQAIGSLWDEFSQEQRGFAVAVYGGAATRPITASSHSFHMYSMVLNLSAKDPFTYVISSLRDRGCLDRAAHLVRQYCSTPFSIPPPPLPPLHSTWPALQRTLLQPHAQLKGTFFRWILLNSSAAAFMRSARASCRLCMPPPTIFVQKNRN